MAQGSGSSAEIWYKIELINGVLDTDAVGGGASTTLASAVNPGATSIVVAADTNIAAGDTLKVSDANGNNMEVVRVDSGYVSGTAVALETGTKINLRHAAGEAVTEVDASTKWFRLGDVTSFTPTGQRALQVSESLTGTRVLSNFREGNYEAGADLSAEVDLTTAGLLFLYALNSEYVTVGTATAGADTTLNAAAAKGDTTVSVTSETGFAVGEFAEVGATGSTEVIKIGAVAVNTLTLDTTAHPNGLRRAHANGVQCEEVIAPFTHTITRGNDLPPGLSFLLRFSDINSDVLIRGNRLSNLTFNLTPDNLPSMSISSVAKAYQIFSLSDAEDIFGTPTTIEHLPYVHHEGDVKIDDAIQTVNQFEDLSFVIENTIQGNFVIGSPLRGAITPGEGSVTGSFTYQYENQQFAEATVTGAETKVELDMVYQADTDHSLNITVWKSKFEGTPHPGVDSKDPITDSKNFTGRLDTAQTPDTDTTITMKNNQPTLEYPTETEIS